jgi:WD40 repeat protein
MRNSFLAGAMVLFIFIPTPAQQPSPGRVQSKGANNLAALWADLADTDAKNAYKAILALSKTPDETTPYLALQLQPVLAPELALVRRLIEDLNSETFTVRDKADRELAKLGPLVEGEMNKALQSNPPLELRQRLEKLVRQVAGSVSQPEHLRGIRAVEVLENIGTPEAKTLVWKCAEGAPDAPLTHHAKNALERWGKRQALPMPRPPATTDLLADPLPQGALARIGTQHFRLGFGANGYVVAYSPDGKFIAVGGAGDGVDGNPIAIFDAASGKALQRLKGHAHVVRTVAFSADGKLLVTGGGDARLAVWDWAKGQRLWLSDQDMGSDSATFLADSKTVAADRLGRSICLVDALNGTVRTTLNGHEGRVFSIAASADGKLLASCGMESAIHVWDAGEGQEVKKLEVKEARALRVFFSRDAKLLACCAFPDTAFYLWDLPAGKQRWRVPAEEDSWRLAGFSPDGSELYALGRDLRVLDAVTGKERRRFAMPHEMVPAAVSPDGKYVACMAGYTRDGELRLYDLQTGAAVNRMAGHGRPVGSLAFSPDGKRLVTASAESQARIWEAATGKLLKDLPTSAEGVAWSHDGRVIATSANGSLCLWNAANAKKLREFLPTANDYKAVGLPDGQGITRVVGFSVKPGGGPVAFLPGDKHLIYCSETTRISLADANTINPLDAGMSAEDNMIRGSIGPVLIPYAVAQESGIIAVDSNTDRKKPVVLWDPKTDKQLLTTNMGGSVLAISPSGHLLAVDTESGAVLVDGKTGKEKQLLPRTTSHVAAAFSPDGRMLATASGPDGAVTLWETASIRERRTFPGHGQPVRTIAFSPDGSRLATGSNDTTVLIWDVHGK